MTRPCDVVITVDVGGSGVKLAAYSIASHRSLGHYMVPWPTTSWSAEGSEFDAACWWAAAEAALAGCVSSLDLPARVYAGITVGAIRIPFVLIDDRGDPVGPCISNGDRRAVAEAAELGRMFGASVLYETTGHWPAAEFGLPKLLWLRRHRPELLARTRHLLQLHDWFILRLSGQVLSELSSAAMSQLVAVNVDRWADDLLRSLGMPIGWFPELCPAGTIAGGLCPEVAGKVGLPGGLPVFLGGGDTQLSALGAGAVVARPPVVIVAGTTVPIQLACPDDVVAGQHSGHTLLRSRHLVRDWWALEVNAGAVGGPLSILAETAAARRIRSPAETSIPGFRCLELAASAPRLSVVVGNPQFDPASWAVPPDGVIVGLAPEHSWDDVQDSARQHSALAVCSLVDQLRDQAPADADRLVVTGGLSRNPSWVQAVADAIGQPVHVPDTETSPGVGGASVVVGEPLWSALDEELCHVYEPRPEASERYRRQWSSYIAVCDEIRHLSRRSEVA